MASLPNRTNQIETARTWMTDKQLSEWLQVTGRTIYNFRKLGMPYYKLGTQMVRYNAHEILRWIKETQDDQILEQEKARGTFPKKAPR